MKLVPLAATAALLLPFAAACQGSAVTAFPPGLEPLEVDDVPPPAATATDPYPEMLSLTQGMDTMGAWVHATGYVHASVADVYAAMKDPAVVVDQYRQRKRAKA